MPNAWLSISLEEYEAHMSLPEIGQARALAEEMARLTSEFKPESLALLGCAGGNGLERVDPSITRKIVAVDVNPSFVATATRRHAGRFIRFQAAVCDVGVEGEIPFEPVDLIFAGLLFEYVPLAPALRFCRAGTKNGGLLACVVQRPCVILPEVTPSPYKSLEALSPHMRLVAPETLARGAEALGFTPLSSRPLAMPNGKVLQTALFKLAPGS